MKKYLSMLLALVMVMSLLAGCGSSKEETTAAAGETTAAAGETTAAGDETAAPAADSDFKVGFIFLHDQNSTYDLNFINAAKAACEQLGVAYDLRTMVDESEECYNTACELADDGCDIIFADSFGHEDYMIQAAKEYPNVQFSHATGVRAHTEGLDNYHNAFASIYEGRFLAGVVAGMKLNEMIEAGEITADQAKIGYVGAMTYAEVISGYTSFFLGARYICPSATMEVTFTGSWYDETAEKEAANTLMDNGCVLISQHADSMGAPTACENRGVPNVSYNGSTISACPKTFLVSSRIDWTPYYVYAISATMNGENFDIDWTGTLQTGSVVLTELNEAAVAEGTADKLAEVRAKLESGELHVFDTSTFKDQNGAEVTSYMADIDFDEAYQGDTEVIIDGYFHESEFRSAPAFDIQIEGITLLDQ